MKKLLLLYSLSLIQYRVYKFREFLSMLYLLDFSHYLQELNSLSIKTREE